MAKVILTDATFAYMAFLVVLALVRIPRAIRSRKFRRRVGSWTNVYKDKS